MTQRSSWLVVTVISPARDGLLGVGEQVHEDLVELSAGPEHVSELAIMAVDRDPALDLVGEQVQAHVERVVQVELGELFVVRMGEGFQIAHDPRRAAWPRSRSPWRARRSAANSLATARARWPDCPAAAGGARSRGRTLASSLRAVASSGLDAVVDAIDGIVDFVGQAGHELAERAHLFRLDQLALQGFEFLVGRLQARDSVCPGRRAGRAA